MTRYKSSLTTVDELVFLVEDFQREVHELYRRDRINFTSNHYEQVKQRVNKICDILTNNETGISTNNLANSDHCVNEEITELSMDLDELKVDLEKTIENIEKEESPRQHVRTVSLKYLERWQQFLDEQEEIGKDTFQDDGSFVRKRILQFDKKERRKSSAIYSTHLNCNKMKDTACFQQRKKLSKSQSLPDIDVENAENSFVKQTVPRTIRELPIHEEEQHDISKILSYITTYENLAKANSNVKTKPKVIGGIVSK